MMKGFDISEILFRMQVYVGLINLDNGKPDAFWG